MIFTNMAGSLQSGWTATTNWWNDTFKPAVSSALSTISPVSSVLSQTGSLVSSFFPTQQKTVIKPSVVSNQTYRPTTTPVKTPLAGWSTFTKQYPYAQSRTVISEKDAPSLWERIKAGLVKKEVAGKAIDTFFNVLERGATMGLGLLSERFSKNEQGRIEPATNAPPTTPAPSLWDMFWGGQTTQPVQSYGIGYMPYQPIPDVNPAISPVELSSQPGIGNNLTPILIVGGVIVAIVLFSRRTA
ncbi:hypothetical protein ES702_05955 [subsurface metagenome]